MGAERTGTRFTPGTVVAGAYEILGVLGEGGMGIVYEARDIDLGRRVAIKAPLFAAYDAALRREAQALAALSGERFVKVHHLARHGDLDLLVLERLFGETLQDRLDAVTQQGHKLPIPEVLDVVVAIADALAAAHRCGIAQRDLKPSNVMLTGRRIVLFDLGLFVPEVLVDPDADICGSAEYIAPEVLRRDVRRGEGPLVDLYALGVIAFELLTGTTPFAGPTMQITLANHVMGKRPPLRALRPDVPRALEALVDELLARYPEDRPPSAEAVVWQVEAMRMPPPSERRHSLHVVAIDDEPHVGTALKRALESAFPRMEVEATTDGRKVMDRSTSRLPDIVLVDLNMPRANGIEVCMGLLAVPPEKRPTIVAMSSQAKDEDVAVLEALGVSHFVPKDASFLRAMSDVIGTIRSEIHRTV